MIARRIALALLSATALGACVQIQYPDRLLICGERGEDTGRTCGFQFPSGAARAGDHLLVASSNFDLRYLTGGLSSFSLAEIDAAVDSASTVAGRVPLGALPEPVDTVLLGDFAGEVAVAELDGAFRAFVPVRSSTEVVAVDVEAGGKLRCGIAGEIPGGEEARDESGETLPFCTGEPFPRQDPSQVLVLGDNVYVGHAQARRGERGVIGAAKAGANLWSSPPDGPCSRAGTVGCNFVEIDLSTTAVGGLAGRCFPGGCAEGGTVYATGRTISGQRVALYAFDFLGDDLVTSPIFTGDLSPQTEGADARGLAVTADGSRAYLAYRAPEGLATVDLTRLPAELSRGCADPLPPGGCGTVGLPPALIPVPAFDVTRTIPAPTEPRAITSIPRTLQDGTRSDLLVLTYRQGLAFFDTRTGLFAGQVVNAGDLPVGLVVVPRGEGVRIYAPSFATGKLAVVDVPDLLAPATARLVALLGAAQETTL